MQLDTQRDGIFIFVPWRLWRRQRPLQILTRRLICSQPHFVCVSKPVSVSVFLFGSLRCLIKLERLFLIWDLMIRLKFKKGKMTRGGVERWGKRNWLGRSLCYFTSVQFQSIDISWLSTSLPVIGVGRSIRVRHSRGAQELSSLAGEPNVERWLNVSCYTLD